MSLAAPLNRTVWITSVVMGITLAVGGFHHGLFESLQGNRPTPGFGIHSIGPEHVRWEYGTDDAITILPSFLLTGLTAMALSLAIVAWCARGLKRRYGASVFLTLFVVLTLVGGGVGHVLFFVTAWAYTTRIRGGLSWWRRRLGPRAREVLSRAWLPALVLSSLLFVTGLELSVFGYPPMQTDPDRLLTLIWSILLASFVMLNLAYAGAIARDVVGAGERSGGGAGHRRRA